MPLRRPTSGLIFHEVFVGKRRTSVRLDDGAGALVAIREAVEIRRRLAQDNPAPFAPDLARSLKTLEGEESG